MLKFFFELLYLILNKIVRDKVVGFKKVTLKTILANKY